MNRFDEDGSPGIRNDNSRRYPSSAIYPAQIDYAQPNPRPGRGPVRRSTRTLERSATRSYANELRGNPGGTVGGGLTATPTRRTGGIPFRPEVTRSVRNEAYGDPAGTIGPGAGVQLDRGLAFRDATRSKAEQPYRPELGPREHRRNGGTGVRSPKAPPISGRTWRAY